MLKTYPMTLLMCAAVALGGTGCTQPSVKGPTITMDALAKQLGVSGSLLQAALRAGYSPEIQRGKTMFCRHEEHIGTLVPTRSCEDPERLQVDLETRQQFVDDLHRQVDVSVDTQRPSPAP